MLFESLWFTFLVFFLGHQDQVEVVREVPTKHPQRDSPQMHPGPGGIGVWPAEQRHGRDTYSWLVFCSHGGRNPADTQSISSSSLWHVLVTEEQSFLEGGAAQ